jgi:CRISPR-associated protein (TIGR02710 family)
MNETSQHTLLIATVGGAPQPIVASIKKWSPVRVVFVVSNETRASVITDTEHAGKPSPCVLTLLQTNGVTDFDGRWEFFNISDPQNYTSLVREMRDLDAKVGTWKESYPAGQLVVDFTGGTKAMSAAIALIVSRWTDTLVSYVGGTERGKDGVGVVVDGKEQILHAQNPWEALGYLVEDQAKTLFNNGNFAAAQQILDPARKAAESPRKGELSVLIALCEFFDLWDKFQHSDALSKVSQINKNWNNLILVDATKNSLKSWFGTIKPTLETLCAADSAKKRKAQAIDLVANANRRIQQGAYDDAVARLYRATEALAQAQLFTYDFPDTSTVPFEKLPEVLQQEWVKRDRDEKGNIKLALQDDYKLLATLNDAIGQTFADLGLNDPQKSPLVARNQSILAHGYTPISDKAARQLFETVLQLLDTDENHLLTFPNI